MINTRDITPRIMSYMSRDFQLMLKLLDLVANSIKLDIDYFTDLIDPYKCKSTWLPQIASLVGYRYRDDLSFEQNRNIIINYKALVRLRGSIQGVRLAVAVYLKLIGRDDTSYRVTLPAVTSGNEVAGYIYIDDQYLDLSKIPLLVDLLEIVRPVGVKYVIRRATATDYTSQVYAPQGVTLYQMQYPLDIPVGSSVEGAVNREEARSDNGEDDNLEFTLENTDNVVGHSIVPKEEN